MVDNRRYRVVKTKLNDTEYRKFISLVDKSGVKNNAEFLRERIFLSESQIVKREKMAGKIGQEQLEGQMCILSHMHSVINQYRAGVDTQLAVEKLEEDVKKLCQLLRL